MKLSVLFITYNHEKFISQALDGILMQKVDFDYEIVIGEDRSTDNTRAVITQYMERHPGRIRLLERDKNVGPIENFIQTYKACRGEYLAMIDGDDYWTSPDKLQKQVDYLDRNADFSIVFHPIVNRDEMDGKLDGYTWPKDPRDVYTLEDLLRGCFIHTASVVCRNGLFGEFPEWFRSTIMYDWPLHVLNAQYGKIGCLPEIMAVYRIHGGGLWSALDKPGPHLEYIKFYGIVNRHFNYRYDKLIKSRISYHQLALSNVYIDLAIRNEDTMDPGQLKKYVVYSIVHNPLNRHILNSLMEREYKDKIKLLFRSCLPGAYAALKNIKLLVSK